MHLSSEDFAHSSVLWLSMQGREIPLIFDLSSFCIELSTDSLEGNPPASSYTNVSRFDNKNSLNQVSVKRSPLEKSEKYPSRCSSYHLQRM